MRHAAPFAVDKPDVTAYQAAVREARAFAYSSKLPPFAQNAPFLRQGGQDGAPARACDETALSNVPT